MKNLFANVRSVRGVLALGATLLILPLTSAFNTAQADPPRYAPAYGYRRKTTTTRRYTYRRPTTVYRRTYRTYRPYRRPTVVTRTYRSPNGTRRTTTYRRTYRTYRR